MRLFCFGKLSSQQDAYLPPWPEAVLVLVCLETCHAFVVQALLGVPTYETLQGKAVEVSSRFRSRGHFSGIVCPFGDPVWTKLLCEGFEPMLARLGLALLVIPSFSKLQRSGWSRAEPKLTRGSEAIQGERQHQA